MATHHQAEHKTFKKMKTTKNAKMVNQKDALELVREMTVINDEFQTNFRTQREKAIRLAEELYPSAVEAGVDFMHKGQIYNVSETNKKWDFTHVTTDPIFQCWRDNVREKKYLKEDFDSEMSKLNKEYEQIMKEIRKRFPYMKPKSSKKVLKVIRSL